MIRGNVGFRLQTNRIKIDETFSLISSFSESNFGEFETTNSTITHGEQINYEVVPGVHRYFQVNKWLFSGGIEMPFTIYDIYKFTQTFENTFLSTSTDFRFEQTSTEEIMGEIPGGYDVGIGANFGIQYALNNNLRLAIQYAPSMRHYKIGGETEFERNINQTFIEQFQNEPEVFISNNANSNFSNTNTLSKVADFRQKMNFALVISF